MSNAPRYAPLPPELAQFARTPAEQERDAPSNLHESAATAVNAPTQFPAKERGQYLKDMVSQIEIYKADQRTEIFIREKMKDFVANYPKLFDMVMKPMYDRTQLNVMIRMLEIMGSGELTQHQASLIVGKKLASTYIPGN